MRRIACPALIFVLSMAGVCSALTLDKVRVAEHPYFSRVVLEFDRPVREYRVHRGPAGRTLWVMTPAEHKPGLDLPDELPPGLASLSLSTAGKADSRFLIGVPEGSKVRIFVLPRDSYGTDRLILDILRPSPAGRLARMERITSLPERPWRPVAAFPPATEIQPVQAGASSPPAGFPTRAESAPEAKGLKSASKAVPRAMTAALLPLPPQFTEVPKDFTPDSMHAQRPPTPRATPSDNNTLRRPRGSGSYFNRLGRFITGADLKETLPNVHGPIPLRFNNPLHVFLYQFIPERAKLLHQDEHAFRLDFNQSHELGQFNTINEGDGTSPIDASVPLRIFVHTEVSAFRLHYDYGILDWLQAGIELPILYHHVNSFTNELKEAFEKYVSGKRSLLKIILEKRPDLRSARFFIVDGGKTLIDSDTDTAGLGEMALRAKFRILRETNWIPATAFRVGLKLPTATDDQFGSGGVDGALSLLFEKKLWDAFVAHLNYSVTIPSDPFESKNLNPEDFFTYWTFALEWDFFKRWALVAQFSGSDAPYEAPPGTQEGTEFTELIAATTYVVGGGLRLALNERLMAMAGFQTDVVGRVGATADETTLFISVGFRIPSSRGSRR